MIREWVTTVLYVTMIILIVYLLMVPASYFFCWAIGCAWTLKTPIAFEIVWVIWRLSMEFVLAGEEGDEE